MSRVQRSLIVYAPDGTAVVDRTAGGYDFAGIVQQEPGAPWVKAAHGWSEESVRKRTRAALASLGCADMHVGPLFEETAPVIRAYFGTHAVHVVATFTPATSWVNGPRRPAGKSALRDLAMEGIIAVGIGGTGDPLRYADFQMTEIARSARFRLPSALYDNAVRLPARSDT